MKKRQVMSLVLAGIMAASLTACGGGTAANNKETKAEAGQTESGKTEIVKDGSFVQNRGSGKAPLADDGRCCGESDQTG